MNTEKILMSEVATLYYKKNLTQQEIAETLHLSRQTVSKLLSDAIEEKIVEIIIHDPEKDCKELEEQICAAFGIRSCVVCSVSGRNESVHRLMTVRRGGHDRWQWRGYPRCRSCRGWQRCDGARWAADSRRHCVWHCCWPNGQPKGNRQVR